MTIIDELRRSSTMADIVSTDPAAPATEATSIGATNIGSTAAEAVVIDRVADTRRPPRTVAGATVLQIVPSLRPSPTARAAVNIAHALVRAGGRAIIAAEDGPLVNELRAFGGEWQACSDTNFNPIKLRKNVERFARLVATGQIDIIHARSAGAAWSALPVAERYGVSLVTELSDIPYAYTLFGAFHLRALSSGDYVITHSAYDSRPFIQRYGIPPKRVVVIPRTIDLSAFDPARIPAERVALLRKNWGIPSGARVVLVPGRLAPWNGQIAMVDVARILTDRGMRGVTFVLVGDDRRHPRYARSVLAKAKEAGVGALFRLVGQFPDLPAAFAVSDIVVAPAIKAPITGRIVAEAQAIGRPVIATAVGALPENMLAPPRMPEELRTGWMVAPGATVELAQALAGALSLDDKALRTLGLRARQFASYMFSPECAINATLDVYNSLLQRGS